MEIPTKSELRTLPIFKHFNESEITEKVDKFRKGEKNLFWFVKLAAICGAGYGLWVYVLPTVFKALGQMFAIGAVAIFLIAFVMALPVIVKALRAFTRFLHKSLIKHDPFAELERQRGLMIQNQQKFRMAKGKIANLRNDMEIEADKSEKDAKSYQSKILSLDKKAQQLKTKMDEMVKANGVSAKGEDEYVQTNAEFIKVLSESSRIQNMLAQCKDFVTKYGTRANIMKKFGQKLTMVETSMDIKVLDFDATVEILKKDFEFSKKSKEATESAKSAMLFTKSWELEYALDVVTSTIANDIAITAGNLNDIDTLTSKYSMDSDELYANLGTLADNIKVGKDDVPSAKTYMNPEYKLTSDDKIKSGGFGDLF